ncbi:MAG TPA: iron-sulfur cluster assembly protein [Methanothrix sp.]|nr:iron-sulfur cluster assembly protein [Methanothrix sp.]
MDLGLIKDIIISGYGNVEVNMFLTYKACPLVSNLSSRIRRRVEGLPGIRQASAERGTG